MVTLLLSMSSIFSDYNFDLIAKNCLAAQQRIGNKYIYLESETEFTISMDLIDFEFGPMFMVAFHRTGSELDLAGPFSFCHFQNDEVTTAFFEYGEFGGYDKNKVVFIEGADIDPTLTMSNSFSFSCSVKIQEDMKVKCTYLGSTDKPS